MSAPAFTSGLACEGVSLDVASFANFLRAPSGEVVVASVALTLASFAPADIRRGCDSEELTQRAVEE